MIKWIVYVHINKKNGKRYFGITSRGLSARCGKHGERYDISPFFYNAILKNGWDNFDHIVLHDNLTALDAKAYEKHYITLYDTKNKMFGYNLTLGGDGSTGRTHISDEARATLSRVHTGNKYSLGHTVSKESREIMRNSKLGKRLTKEHISKIVESRKKTWVCIPVYQYTLEGVLVKKWRSSQDTKSEGFRPCGVVRCCRGDRNKYGGYVWAYSLKTPEEAKVRIRKRRQK